MELRSKVNFMLSKEGLGVISFLDTYTLFLLILWDGLQKLKIIFLWVLSKKNPKNLECIK